MHGLRNLSLNYRFSHFTLDHFVFSLHVNTCSGILIVYTDDILVSGSDLLKKQEVRDF